MGKRIYSKFLRDFSVKVNALINIGYKDVKEREEEGFDRRHTGGGIEGMYGWNRLSLPAF